MTEEKMREAWQRALAAERDEERDEAPIELTFHCSKDEMYLLGFVGGHDDGSREGCAD